MKNRKNTAHSIYNFSLDCAYDISRFLLTIDPALNNYYVDLQ